MNRRKMLHGLGAVGVGSLAGCNSASDRSTEQQTNNSSNQTKPASSQRDGASEDDEENEDGSPELYRVSTSSDGRTLLLGSRLSNSHNGVDSGAAFIYEKNNDTWSQQATIVPSDGRPEDLFGDSLSLSGDGNTAVIRTPNPRQQPEEYRSSVYVFRREGDSWLEQAQLSPDKDDPEDHFGFRITTSNAGDAIFVSNSGRVYVFVQSGDKWRRQSVLVPESDRDDEEFGFDIAVSDHGNVAVIGSPNNTDKDGVGYVFERSGSTWEQEAMITHEDDTRQREYPGVDTVGYGDGIGFDVSLANNGQTIIFGAYRDFDPDGRFSGSAFVFERSENGWKQQTKIVPEDIDRSDGFGAKSILANSGVAFIAADGDDNANGSDAGSVYVYVQSDTGWRQQAKLTASDGEPEDELGRRIAATGDGKTLFVSSTNGNGSSAQTGGEVYVFTRSDGGWNEQTKLTAPKLKL